MAHLADLMVGFLETHLPYILKLQVHNTEATVAEKPAGWGQGRLPAAQGALRGRRREACS